MDNENIFNNQYKQSIRLNSCQNITSLLNMSILTNRKTRDLRIDIIRIIYVINDNNN
jgi:hypothetical protein